MRRQGEEFSVSFLDVICCGFGAIILLLMLSKSFESQVTSITSEKLQAQLQQREQQLLKTMPISAICFLP
jgi:tRNA1(Val) A37 N6-methylase TrmN6